MPVSFSIKHVPDEVAEKLRRRAAQRHRSLQGVQLAILEESVAREPTLTPTELVRRLKTLGLETPSESAAFVRKDRDADSRG